MKNTIFAVVIVLCLIVVVMPVSSGSVTDITDEKSYPNMDKYRFINSYKNVEGDHLFMIDNTTGDNDFEINLNVGNVLTVEGVSQPNSKEYYEIGDCFTVNTSSVDIDDVHLVRLVWDDNHSIEKGSFHSNPTTDLNTLRYTIVMYRYYVNNDNIWYYYDVPGVESNTTHYTGLQWEFSCTDDEPFIYGIGYRDIYTESKDIAERDNSGDLKFILSNLNYPLDYQEFNVSYNWNYYDENYYPDFEINDERIEINNSVGEVKVTAGESFKIMYYGFTFDHDIPSLIERMGQIRLSAIQPETPETENVYFSGDNYVEAVFNQPGTYLTKWAFYPYGIISTPTYHLGDLKFIVTESSESQSITLENFPQIGLTTSLWTIFLLGLGASVIYLLGKSSRR